MKAVAGFGYRGRRALVVMGEVVREVYIYIYLFMRFKTKAQIHPPNKKRY